MQTEFEIIEKFFFKKSIKAYKGIGDDAALFKKDNDSLWAISTDTLNINVHFMATTDPYKIGWKAMAVNVSDILAINCPATKETVNIINKETLEYFPTGAIITNSARGDMIDDEALVQALINRKIYSVGLDVYNGEPNLYSGYLNQPNAFILPHLGSATKETRTAMGNLAIDNIDEFFKNGKFKKKISTNFFINYFSENRAHRLNI